MSGADAMRELVRGAGTQFDPTVIETLIECLEGDARVASGSAA